MIGKEREREREEGREREQDCDVGAAARCRVDKGESFFSVVCWVNCATV